MAATVLEPGKAPRHGRRARGWGHGTARACDVLLVWCLLALATWTVAYHACLLLGAGTAWALLALAAACAPCGVAAVRTQAERPPLPETGRAGAGSLAATAAAGLAALVAAGALAVGGGPWPLTWALWVLAAATATVAVTVARAPRSPGGGAGTGAPAALGWAAAGAGLALFLVRPNVDDAYYLRQATWIAEHGRFPLGDTLHSHDVLPAVFSPPLPSFEPLLGAVAGAAGVSAAGLAYLAVGPVAAALAVLALWRLLRTWEVRLAGTALTVAVVFLLTALEPADSPHAKVTHLPGDFLVTRAWQGKVVLVAVLVPLLFSLLHDHAARPRRGGLLLLAAAGTAAVGLSTTATFLVPVIATACLAPLAIRRPRQAAAALAATCAYPVAGMVAALAAGPRQPARWTPSQIAPEALVLPAMGAGVVGIVAVSAALAGPLWIAPRLARQGVVAAALIAALAFAPGVPQLVYEITGLGRPLWRVTWAMPTAALVGVLATQPAARHRIGAVRLLPALAVCLLLALAGTPVWEGRGTRLAGHPEWKRDPVQLAMARAIAARAVPGAHVLAPEGLSQTLLLIDGRAIAVAPREFYTRSLPATPESQLPARLLLWSFVMHGLHPDVREDRIVAALRRARVDVACVRRRARRAQLLLARADYRTLVSRRAFWCGAPAAGPDLVTGRPSRARSPGARARRACGSVARRRCRSGRTARAGGS